jgi:hypothetical protein
VVEEVRGREEGGERGVDSDFEMIINLWVFT